jgi:pimeloyl-ACP methyl ester carboxylesterase
MSDASNPNGAPTVVLVHGAFGDSSSWNGVIERLQARGVQVKAAANPLRGVSSDSAYVAGVFAETPGPLVAVGHSYGGAVITNAAARADNVVGLVFVAAFAPEEGEALGEATAASKDAVLGTALVPQHYPSPNGGEPAVEFALDPAKIHDAFASDLPASAAAAVGATQRPVAELAFSEPSGLPAWKDLPSWAIIPLADKAAGTDVLRSMAKRAGSKVTELEGSHVIMVSQPGAVTDVILEAVSAAG